MNTNLIYCIDTFIYVAISIALSWVASQTFKTVLKVAITKNKNARYIVHQFFSDGDFPSSHTTVSTTASIVVTPLLFEAVCEATSKTEILTCIAVEVTLLIWTAMTIRDALGIRMRVQELSKITQQFLKETPKYFIVSESLQEFWEGLGNSINIKAGHMPHEVIGGLILALIFGVGANSIRTNNYIVLLIDIAIAVAYFIVSYLLLSKKINPLNIIDRLKEKKK